ncbi:MAG: hypothetical protein ACLRZ2_01855 [Veillonella sp.]
MLDRRKTALALWSNTPNYNGPDDSFYPGKTINLDAQKIWDRMGKHGLVAG